MIYNLAEFLRQPLKIGDKSINKRLVLAPMSFLGHIAFRELVSRYGGIWSTVFRDVQRKGHPQRKPICFALLQVAR